MEMYDYIVVGGGLVGCMVVYWLVKVGWCVLLFEDGLKDDSLFIWILVMFICVFGM